MKSNPAPTVSRPWTGVKARAKMNQTVDLLRHFDISTYLVKVHSHGWKQNRTGGPVPVRHNEGHAQATM
jgi:hypothetical protein